jgi:ABC-type lipoprotein export system ATPase subunit
MSLIGNNIIVLNNISRDFGNRCILKNIKLEIKKGDFISILGASGTGKSTLLNIIGMLDNDYKGQYIFNENIVNKKNSEVLRKYNIGFVFQLYYLISSLSIKDNILLPYLYIDDYDSYEIQNKMEELIVRLNLTNLLDQDCSSLSGGEKQRVAIARALIHNPSVLICDEPTGNLDDKNAKIVMDILREENKKGKTIIVVTHSKEVANMTNKIYCLESGGIKLEKDM